MKHIKQLTCILLATSAIVTSSIAKEESNSTTEPKELKQKKSKNPLAVLQSLDLNETQQVNILDLKKEYRTKILEIKTARKESSVYLNTFIDALDPKKGLNQKLLAKDAKDNFIKQNKIMLHYTSKIIEQLTPKQRKELKAKLKKQIETK